MGNSLSHTVPVVVVLNLVHLYSRSEKVRARTGLESTFVPEMITIFGEINLTQYRIFGRRSENFGSGKKSLIQNILQGAKSTIPGTEMGQISIVTRAHNLTQYRRNSGNLTQSGQIMRSLEFYSMHLSLRVFFKRGSVPSRCCQRIQRCNLQCKGVHLCKKIR